MDQQQAIGGFRRSELHHEPQDQLTVAFREGGNSTYQSLYADSSTLTRSESSFSTCCRFKFKSCTNIVEILRLFDVASVERQALEKGCRIYRDSVPKNVAAAFRICDNFGNLQESLLASHMQWANKERWFKGKAQNIFHQLCKTLDGHRTILDAFPSSNEYVSIFCAGFNTIIQVQCY